MLIYTKHNIDTIQIGQWNGVVFVGLVMRKSDNFPGYRSLSNDQFSIWARNVKTGKTPLDHCSYLIRSSSSWDHVPYFVNF